MSLLSYSRLDLSNNRNNFDGIRLLASLMVVFAHSFPLTGNLYNNEPLYFITKVNDFGHLGVSIFLFISGFLISKSAQNSISFYSFLKKRLIRMLPALFMTLTVTVFFIGTIFTNYSITEYFFDYKTFLYFKNIFLYNPQYNLPGVFISCPYSAVVNGSIWTLCYEFTFYIGLFFFILLFKKHSILFRVSVVVFLIVFFLTNIFRSQLNIYQYTIPFFNLKVQLLLDLFLYFISGVVFYYSKKIQPLYCFISGIVLLAALFFKNQIVNQNVFYFIVPLLTYGIAFSKRINLNFLVKNGDYSYGIYLYSFLIQQIVISVFPNLINPYIFFFVTSIIAYALGVCSWHLVEKRILEYK